MLRDSASLSLEPKPAHINGGCLDYTIEDIEWVASRFDVSGPILVSPFPGRGNINIHTFEVTAGARRYLLQKVNSNVFTLPYRVMKSMALSIEAQRERLEACGVLGQWEPIELVRTRDGSAFLDLTDEHGWSVWRMMVRIDDVRCFKCLAEVGGRSQQLHAVEQVGRGLAIYSDLTSTIEPSAVDGSLPGYRDTGLYYRQFYSVLKGNRTLADAVDLLPDDPILRASTQKHFVVALEEEERLARLRDPELLPYLILLREREAFAMSLWLALGQGRIRHTLIHGDTKIENFLFCAKTGLVKSLVDLDTIMGFTWLADWGDMVRSLCNVAGERERNLDRVVVDTEVYLAAARGFLGQSREVREQEVRLMCEAAQVITLELGLRFLTDYLRGDTYFQLGPGDPPDLNKVRALVQLTLYQRLVELGPAFEEEVCSLRR